MQVEGSGEDETVAVTIFGQRREQVEVSVLGVAVGARVVVNLEFPILFNVAKTFETKIGRILIDSKINSKIIQKFNSKII